MVRCLCFVAALSLPASASAWSPLRAENANVKRGNALMAQEQYSEALTAYDEAARELPAERGVQLNRGLALLKQDLTEQSTEAFEAASDPSAPTQIRADAYYNMGIVHAREGDSIAQQEDHERASAHFREAASSFKEALRMRPGDRNAAWNLEYALMRIREEEDRQQQQQQDQQQQDSQEQQDQQERQQQQDPQQEGQQEQQQQDDSRERQGQNEDEPGSENESDNQPDSEPESDTESANENEPQQSTRPEQEQPMAPADVQRFLDALEQNEENLPLQRARRRSAGRRPPEKDW